MTPAIARVCELWRYPVKSMGGERVQHVSVLHDGIAHDRRFAFESSGAPAGKPLLTSRERATMLLYQATATPDGVVVSVPQGGYFRVDDPALLRHLEGDLPQGNRLVLRQGGDAGPFTDVRPVALLSTATIGQVRSGFCETLDARRFRANLIVQFTAAALEIFGDAHTFPEDALCGQVLSVGAACRLRVLERVPRCRMVTLSPDTAAADPALMKYLDRRHGGRLGIYAAVERGGEVHVGDPVTLA